MHCTAAPRLEEHAPDKESTFAQEGTLAHAYCAKKLKGFLQLDTKGEEKEIAQYFDQYHTGEMDEYTDTYKVIVLEKFAAAKAKTADAQLLIETRLDFTEYIPDAFGTADAIIIADGLMEVIDFKYGKGVKVDAYENPQMMIYALGAYLAFNFEYRIERVRMTIVQPRIDNLSEFEMSVADLMEWATEELKPKAKTAFDGNGAQAPGEWCQFCKVKNSCRALADHCTATYENNQDPKLLKPEEMAESILPRLALIKAWVESVDAYALEQALAGVAYPGYKIVAGRSNRRISDTAKVTEILTKNGFELADIQKPVELRGITDLEKLVGKKRFATICKDYLIKPQGKPTLVPASDKREAYNAADDDFSNIEV